MKTARFALAVIIPLAVMVGWVLRLQLVVSSGAMIHVGVTGYDPRDLLAGHYLQYQLDLGEQSPCGVGAGGEQCVCFTESNSSLTRSQIVWSGACAAAPRECRGLLKGRCEHSRFVAGVERFYFAEGMSDMLRFIPTGASVMLKTDSDGQAVVVDLMVEGEPLAVYVERAREEAALASPSPSGSLP